MTGTRTRPNAQETVKERYPNARVIRSIFGLVVATDHDNNDYRLGTGRAYWEEEAWISAVEEMENL